MTEIEIIATNEATHGAYRAAVAGTDVPAELTWRTGGEASAKVRIADHTFTPPQARGQGIAAKLVEAMVADARAQGFTIVPQCPYVAVLFRKHPEWEDLLAR